VDESDEGSPQEEENGQQHGDQGRSDNLFFPSGQGALEPNPRERANYQQVEEAPDNPGRVGRLQAQKKEVPSSEKIRNAAFGDAPVKNPTTCFFLNHVCCPFRHGNYAMFKY
jgi:hypothetical protein